MQVFLGGAIHCDVPIISGRTVISVIVIQHVFCLTIDTNIRPFSALRKVAVAVPLPNLVCPSPTSSSISALDFLLTAPPQYNYFSNATPTDKHTTALVILINMAPTDKEEEEKRLHSSCIDSDDDDDDNYDEFDEVEDDDDEDANLSYHPICDPKGATFSSLREALQHDRDVYGFDLLSVLPSASTDDFYESAIVGINMCRKFVADSAEKEDIGSQLKCYLDANFTLSSGNDNDDDGDLEQFYKPVLTDDAFLMTLDDLEDLKRKEEGASDDSGDATLGSKGAAKTQTAAEELTSLQEQLDRAKELIAKLTLEQEGGSDDGDDSTGDAAAAAATKQPVQKRDNDTYYFSSYSTHYIHETMLRDTVRTEAYEKAILSNADTLFKDKVVMDIGCGKFWPYRW